MRKRDEMRMRRITLRGGRINKNKTRKKKKNV